MFIKKGKKILKEVKKLSPDSKYLFTQSNGKRMTSKSYNYCLQLFFGKILLEILMLLFISDMIHRIVYILFNQAITLSLAITNGKFEVVE